MLVALEAGGPLRALLLFLVSPLLWLLELASFEDAALLVMIFVTTVGLEAANVKAVVKATLVKFYLEDVRESAYRVFRSCGGRKYVVTSMPRIMVEPFLKEYLNVDCIVGTELRMFGRRCSGLVASSGLMVGLRRFEALKALVGAGAQIDLGLADPLRDHPFMFLCREIHVVSPDEKASSLSRKDYPRPLIFHNGRFVERPTPLDFLAVLVWLPLGILLAISRILVGVLLPYKLSVPGCALTGLRIRARFPVAHQKAQAHRARRSCGTLYVCSHRTLLDPVFIGIALQHRVSAVTYSLSRFSELISPIPTFRLSRDRSKDGETMNVLLDRGDLVVCPEGTTCREPFLLRFSPLFTEITDSIVPVAVTADSSMFYGTTVRGYKCLDSFFFLMNPTPCYRMEFLERPSGDWSSNYDIANHVQGSIGRVLGFECTNLTRRDKYRMLAGNDGVDTRR